MWTLLLTVFICDGVRISIIKILYCASLADIICEQSHSTLAGLKVMVSFKSLLQLHRNEENFLTIFLANYLGVKWIYFGDKVMLEKNRAHTNMIYSLRY